MAPNEDDEPSPGYCTFGDDAVEYAKAEDAYNEAVEARAALTTAIAAVFQQEIEIEYREHGKETDAAAALISVRDKVLALVNQE